MTGVKGTAALTASVLLATLLVLAGPAKTASATEQMCRRKPATIVGTSGKDTLRGTPGRDVIVGLARRDVIFGGGGNDIVCGGGGADEIHGDNGNDRLYGEGNGSNADRGGSRTFGDVIDGGAGDDVLDVGPWAHYSYQYGERIEFRDAPGAVRVDLTTGRAEGQGRDRIVRVRQIAILGSDEADVIIGTPGPDRVESGPGDDRVDLGSGNDRWHERRSVDSGDDVVDGGGGYDELTSAGGQDTLTGAGDHDVITLFGSGARSVDAGPGDDWVTVIGPDLAGVSLRAGSVDDASGDDLTIGRLGTSKTIPGRLFIDAVAGVMSLTVDGVTTSGTLGGFELYALGNGLSVDFYGSDIAESLQGPSHPGLVAHMGGGDDIVLGTDDDDSIDGGDGLDSAHGEGGTDVCVAVESANSC